MWNVFSHTIQLLNSFCSFNITLSNCCASIYLLKNALKFFFFFKGYLPVLNNELKNHLNNKCGRIIRLLDIFCFIDEIWKVIKKYRKAQKLDLVNKIQTKSANRHKETTYYFNDTIIETTNNRVVRQTIFFQIICILRPFCLVSFLL